LDIAGDEQRTGPDSPLCDVVQDLRGQRRHLPDSKVVQDQKVRLDQRRLELG
jgi:hypothetical protein